MALKVSALRYPQGVAVSDEQMESIRLARDAFHGDWNYTIKPRTRRARRKQ